MSMVRIEPVACVEEPPIDLGEEWDFYAEFMEECDKPPPTLEERLSFYGKQAGMRMMVWTGRRQQIEARRGRRQ